MKVIIATPLYPPDIGGAAAYSKELARRLASEHEVTVVSYGRLPERVPGVRFVCIDKRQPVLLRLIAYTRALWKAAQNADVIYAENGASVELPAGLVALFVHRPLYLHIGDAAGHEQSLRDRLRSFIERFVRARARKVISDSPAPRPEILPFESYPNATFSEYEASWQEHIRMLTSLFAHV